MCASPYPTYQRNTFTTASLRLAYKKYRRVRVLGFLRLNLTFPMETRAFVYKAQFGPRFRVYRDSFYSLTDGRSYERCEGAGKTALSLECGLLFNQNRVRVVGSQLFRAAGNTETGFSYLIYVAFITTWQSVIKGVHVSASGGPALIGVAVRVLIWTVDLGFWLKMLLRRRLWVKAQIHHPLCFCRVRWRYIFP